MGRTPVRRFARVNRQVKVEIDGRRGMTSDLSLGGFSAELSFVPRPGSRICGSIDLNHRVYAFDGEVVWVRGGEPGLGHYSRVGVRFRGIENAYVHALSA